MVLLLDHLNTTTDFLLKLYTLTYRTYVHTSLSDIVVNIAIMGIFIANSQHIGGWGITCVSFEGGQDSEVGFGIENRLIISA